MPWFPSEIRHTECAYYFQDAAGADPFHSPARPRPMVTRTRGRWSEAARSNQERSGTRGCGHRCAAAVLAARSGAGCTSPRCGSRSPGRMAGLVSSWIRAGRPLRRSGGQPWTTSARTSGCFRTEEDGRRFRLPPQQIAATDLDAQDLAVRGGPQGELAQRLPGLSRRTSLAATPASAKATSFWGVGELSSWSFFWLDAGLQLPHQLDSHVHLQLVDEVGSEHSRLRAREASRPKPGGAGRPARRLCCRQAGLVLLGRRSPTWRGGPGPPPDRSRLLDLQFGRPILQPEQDGPGLDLVVLLDGVARPPGRCAAEPGRSRHPPDRRGRTDPLSSCRTGRRVAGQGLAAAAGSARQPEKRSHTPPGRQAPAERTGGWNGVSSSWAGLSFEDGCG